MASLKQLTNRRVARGISRRELAERVGCSPQWIRWLENANTSRPTADLWRNRYEAGLNSAIAEQDALVKAGGSNATG